MADSSPMSTALRATTNTTTVNDSPWLTHAMIDDAIAHRVHVTTVRRYADECERVRATFLANLLRNSADQRDSDPTRMRVTVEVNGRKVSDFYAADFDASGDSPDHFGVIAPAYLAPLTAGAASVLVTYRSPREGTFAEIHTPAGWRDGACVGTRVEYTD